MTTDDRHSSMWLDEMASEVNWNGTKLIDTMGCITAKNSIDLTMSIFGNGIGAGCIGVVWGGD